MQRRTSVDDVEAVLVCNALLFTVTFDKTRLLKKSAFLDFSQECPFILKSSLLRLYALCLACSLRSSFHSVDLGFFGGEFGFLALFFAASPDDVERWELFLRTLLVPQLDVRIVRVTF